jgi:hypothetical protein
MAKKMASRPSHAANVVMYALAATPSLDESSPAERIASGIDVVTQGADRTAE